MKEEPGGLLFLLLCVKQTGPLMTSSFNLAQWFSADGDLALSGGIFGYHT